MRSASLDSFPGMIYLKGVLAIKKKVPKAMVTMVTIEAISTFKKVNLNAEASSKVRSLTRTNRYCVSSLRFKFFFFPLSYAIEQI